MSQEQDTQSDAPRPAAVQTAVDMVCHLSISPQERFAVAIVLICSIVEEANRLLPDHPGNPFKEVRMDEPNPFHMAIDAIQGFLDHKEPREQAPAYAG